MELNYANLKAAVASAKKEAGKSESENYTQALNEFALAANRLARFG